MRPGSASTATRRRAAPSATSCSRCGSASERAESDAPGRGRPPGGPFVVNRIPASPVREACPGVRGGFLNLREDLHGQRHGRRVRDGRRGLDRRAPDRVFDVDPVPPASRADSGPVRHPAPHAREVRIGGGRSEEHTSELQSQSNLVCRLLLEKKKKKKKTQ